MCVAAFAVLSNNKLFVRAFGFGNIKFSMSGTKAKGSTRFEWFVLQFQTKRVLWPYGPIILKFRLAKDLSRHEVQPHLTCPRTKLLFKCFVSVVTSQH